MTASAIQGDREKCLESGMNNYLAKPVRAQTLKALLESYLHRQEDSKEMPNLQSEAQQLVKEALSEAASEQEKPESKKALAGLVDEETGALKMRSRPASVRSATQRWLGPSGGDKTSPT